MLGKLEKVDLREEWKHEALDFTKWLSQKDNLALLSEELGLDELQLIGTEVSVGSFSVDILAEESGTGRKVVVENQLETTNHDHLGKLITYAAGVEAEAVIWVFKDMREEHRQAIDWLNEISSSRVGFFAVQMELWRIEGSRAAAKFNVVSSPNAWAKAAKSAGDGNSLSESNLFQLSFWTDFMEYLKTSSVVLKPRKPQPQHWCDSSIGTSQAHLAFVVSVKDRFVRSEFYIPDNKELYSRLFEKKEEIESRLGFSLDWQELPKAKASRIAVQKSNINLKDPATIQEVFRWYKETGEKLRSVMLEYI